MRVVLTRDSVCAGDDCFAPHESVWEADGAATLQGVLEQAAGYCLQRHSACWVAYLGYGGAAGVPIALDAPGWREPRLLAGAEAIELPVDTLEIFWAYRTRPQVEVLWRQFGGSEQLPPEPEPVEMRRSVLEWCVQWPYRLLSRLR